MGAPGLESLYRRWLSEVWGQGRTDVASELMAEDLIDHNPYPGQPAGLDGHNWAVAMVRRAFPDLRFTADVVVADGDFVAGRWTMTGTNTGVFDLFGLPPTGRPVTMTGQEIFRAHDGKLTEVWHQEDAPRDAPPARPGAPAGHHAPGRPPQRTPLPAAAAAVTQADGPTGAESQSGAADRYWVFQHGLEAAVVGPDPAADASDHDR